MKSVFSSVCVYPKVLQHIIKNENYTSAVRSTKNDFLIKTQLSKLRVLLRSRVLRSVYPREGYRSVTHSPARVNRIKTFSLVLRTETV